MKVGAQDQVMGLGVGTVQRLLGELAAAVLSAAATAS